MFKLAGCRSICDFWPLFCGKDLRDPHFGITLDVCFFPNSWFETQLRTARDFVNQCCTDLLGVQNVDGFRFEDDHTSFRPWNNATVEYTHRTVHDFLETEYMTTLLHAHAPSHFQDRDNLIRQVKLAVLKVVPPDGFSLDVACEYPPRWAADLIDDPARDLADDRIVEESECALTEFVKCRTKDARAELCENSVGRSCWVGSAGENEQQDTASEEDACQGTSWGDTYDVGPSTGFTEAFHQMLWKFASVGLYNLARQLAEFELLNALHRDTITAGSLGLSNCISIDEDINIHDPENPLESLDILLPLCRISVSSVETALGFGGRLNDHGASYSRVYPIESLRSGRTIWHDFIFKWWRLDPRRDWGRYEPENWDLSGISEEAVVVRKPERPSLDRLSVLTEPSSSNAWKIAKVLIAAGAALDGSICLTEWPCGELLAAQEDTEDNEDDIWNYGMHPMEACWRLNIIEVLRVLVPGSGIGELEDLLTKASLEK